MTPSVPAMAMAARRRAMARSVFFLTFPRIGQPVAGLIQANLPYS
jgi:hypothetical protein